MNEATLNARDKQTTYIWWQERWMWSKSFCSVARFDCHQVTQWEPQSHQILIKLTHFLFQKLDEIFHPCVFCFMSIISWSQIKRGWFVGLKHNFLLEETTQMVHFYLHSYEEIARLFIQRRRIWQHWALVRVSGDHMKCFIIYQWFSNFVYVMPHFERSNKLFIWGKWWQNEPIWISLQ